MRHGADRGRHDGRGGRLIRAVEGWEEPIFHNGQVIGHRRRFSDTLTRTLLTRQAPAGGDATRCVHDYPAQAEVDRAWLARFDKLDALERKRARAAQLDWAARTEREGWAP